MTYVWYINITFYPFTVCSLPLITLSFQIWPKALHSDEIKLTWYIGALCPITSSLNLGTVFVILQSQRTTSTLIVINLLRKFKNSKSLQEQERKNGEFQYDIHLREMSSHLHHATRNTDYICQISHIFIQLWEEKLSLPSRTSRFMGREPKQNMAKLFLVLVKGY